MRCQIVVAVDIAKMENVFVCKVSQGNSASKVINAHEYKQGDGDECIAFSLPINTSEIRYAGG